MLLFSKSIVSFYTLYIIIFHLNLNKLCFTRIGYYFENESSCKTYQIKTDLENLSKISCEKVISNQSHYNFVLLMYIKRPF